MRGGGCFGQVRCWGVQWQPNGEIANCAPHAMIQHEAPVLCCDIASVSVKSSLSLAIALQSSSATLTLHNTPFGASQDNATIFSGGCDNKVLMWNAAAGTNTQQIGQVCVFPCRRL